ncbi:SapC family protein [Agaribacterium haliotis]|uniref:SapC family protein n=1 Tax=Agaribacterium haliotis TaxID=2013869 RepID=UPI000BB59225|nr:SapC family protein [Agaribacterium haliotis]
MSKAQLELLSPEIHRDLHVDVNNYDDDAFKVNASYALAGEVASLAHDYPIFVTKAGPADTYQFTALLGFESGENLFVEQGQWRASFMPIDIIRRPFQIMLPEGQSSGEGQIAVDRSSLRLQGTHGMPLFDEEGKASAYLQRIQTAFAQLMSNNKSSAAMAKNLVDLALVSPVKLTLSLKDDDKLQLPEVFSVDEEKLKLLDEKTLVDCHKSGALQLCYLMISSLAHLEKMIGWKNQR